jgi:antitoxin CptB
MAEGDANAARLRWRCRRGVKELDVLLERFLARHLTRLSPAQVATLSRLLDASDPDLMDWVLERQPPPDAAYVPLLKMLRDLLHLPAPT